MLIIPKISQLNSRDFRNRIRSTLFFLFSMTKINPKNVSLKNFIDLAEKGFQKENLNRILCFFAGDAEKTFQENPENGQFIIVEKIIPSEFQEGKDQIIHFFIGHDPEGAKEYPLDESIHEQLKPLVKNPEEWCESGGFGIDLIIFNPEEYHPVNQEFWDYCKAISSGM